MKIKVYVTTDRVGAKVEDEIDIVEDWGMDPNASDEEIEEAAKDWMYENIEWGWTRK